MVALLAAAGSGCGGSLLPAGGTKAAGNVEVTPLSLRRQGSAVEVQIRVRNLTGQVAYVDPPIETHLDVGTSKPLTGLGRCAGATGFPLTSVLGPGDTIAGCLGFSLPAGATPKTLQYGRGLAGPALSWNAGSIPGIARGTVDAPPAPVTARLGTPATVTGTDFGSEPTGQAAQYVPTSVAVTPDTLTDPAPTGQFDHPDDGNRVVAVRVTLRNTGTRPYWALPDSELLLWDSEGHAYGGDVTVTTSMGPMFRGQVVPPGGQATGWVSYQVPRRAVLSRVEYVLSQGGTGAVASWKAR
jgi:Domain of unknown function (DUF4352)